jgi:hypothetical protein
MISRVTCTKPLILRGPRVGEQKKLVLPAILLGKFSYIVDTATALPEKICLLSLSLFLHFHILSYFSIMHNQMSANASSDTERQNSHEFYMFNDVVHSLSWSNLSLTVEDRSTKKPKDLVSNVSGRINAGKYLATFFMDDNMIDIISRRGSGSHGSLWQRKDDTPQRARRPCSSYHRHCARRRHSRIGSTIQEAYVFRRAGGYSRGFLDCSRDSRLCSSSCPPQVCSTRLHC